MSRRSKCRKSRPGRPGPVSPTLRPALAMGAALLALVLLVLAPAGAGAQVGGSTDIIMGTVSGPTGTPLAGARVQVTSVETGVTRTKTTNDKGQYTILFPDGGGQYRVTVQYLGMRPGEASVARVADEDRLVANFTLSSAPTVLQAMTVQGSRRPDPGEAERPTPGSTGRTLSSEELARLPIDPSDPNAIALLAPGVIGLEGSDTSSAGFSIAGQRPDQNQVTLDGLAFDGAGVPQEAVRSTRVVTSTYDVARGQFTGGLVQSTTRGGTNDVSGSFGYSLRDPDLQWTGDENDGGGGFGQSVTQHQLSGGVGGPIARDRLFYFVSGQLRRRLNPLQSLTGADALTLERLGTSADSAARFLDLLGGYGLPATVAAVPDDQRADNFSALTRVDWQLGEDHSLMLRGNFQGSRQDGFRTRALAVPSYGGEQSGTGGGVMATLSSVFGTYLNELRASWSRDDRRGDPYVLVPEGQVRVASDLVSGVLGVSTLDFGGNPGLPTTGANTQVDISNELSLLNFAGHRYKLGGLLSYKGFRSTNSRNAFGSFGYNSLADFGSNTPASFTRTLAQAEREGASLDAALYLGDSWRRGRGLQLTYGARVEYSAYLDTPAYNPEVERLFGRRTDRLPAEVHVSPRIGFSWTLGLPGAQGGAMGGGGFGGGFGGRGGPRGGGGGGDFGPGGANVTVIRGGVGEFRGTVPTQLFASTIDATGLPSGTQQLVCIGDAVPVPDWGGYLLDPSSIPTRCADGGSGVPVASRAPSVALMSGDFGAPRAWRASLGVQRRLSQTLGFNLETSYALGTNLTGARDLNLRSSPAFTLAEEGGRPVYVPASSIVPATGATSVLASREHAGFAQVVETNSALGSRTLQATASLNGVLRRSLIWNLSYTLTRSRDETGFAPGGGFGGGGGGFGAFGFGVGSSTTGGDPNATEWGTSDLERRHAVSGSMSWYARPWLDVTSVVRLTSGQPFTPRVGGDINGDGSRNDRAFVFDPAATADTALAHGMERLLGGAPAEVRSCLSSQLGQVAGRNVCRAGWSPSLDLQMNLRPDLGGRVGRRLSFMVSLINPLAGMDLLLHGGGGLRGWGQPRRPDATLLYVRGFDESRQRYVYEVNERFGDTQGSRTALRNPFQVALQMRLQVGPDRQRDLMMGRLRALGGRGGAGGGLDVAAMIARVAPNPVSAILERRDSLALTESQVAALQLVADSLAARNAVLADSLTRVVSGAGGQADLRTLFPQLQPVLQTVRDNYVAAIAEARKLLTERQWEQLPESLRNPSLQQRGPGGPGGPGGAGGPPRPGSGRGGPPT